MYPQGMAIHDTPVNLLDQSASSYLRSARHQPVLWHPWGEEAFARAQAEDKPILLDIGAVWCHWCHVMDRESYEDPELAAILNGHLSGRAWLVGNAPTVADFSVAITLPYERAGA